MECQDKIINDVHISEYFAICQDSANIFTDPVQFLFDDEKLKMLEYFCDDIEKMSNYEKFSAFVSNLQKMYGSSARQLFEEELSIFFSYEGDITKADPKDLWIVLCEQMSGRIYNYDTALKFSDSEYLPSEFLPISMHCGSYGELINKNIDVIKATEWDFLTVDLSSFEFIYTDRYHAEQFYKEFLDGGKNESFVSGVLYDICREIKRQGKKLFVYADDNYENIKKLINYFSERDVLPTCVIFSHGDTLFNIAKDICGVYGNDRVRILCGLVYSSGDTIESISHTVKNVARVYPIGKLIVGGSLTSSAAFAARDSILKKAVALAYKQNYGT